VEALDLRGEQRLRAGVGRASVAQPDRQAAARERVCVRQPQRRAVDVGARLVGGGGRRGRRAGGGERVAQQRR
jgi:hypothetical protein